VVLLELVHLLKNGIKSESKVFLIFHQKLLTNGNHGEEVCMNLLHFCLNNRNSIIK